MPLIEKARSSSSEIRVLLSQHPEVGEVLEGPQLLEFSQGGWPRRIFRGVPQSELAGLVEMIDNNPMVCANEFTLPSSAALLASIALGPIIDAGLLVESPSLIVNAPTSEEDVLPYLQRLGWDGGVLLSSESTDLGNGIAAAAIAEIATPDRLEDLDDLYEERFGRSFFVRLQDEDWDIKHVLNSPCAMYRLRINPDVPRSLLTIQVMADLQGKCGPSGMIHAMNVMAGLEESLGI